MAKDGDWKKMMVMDISPFFLLEAAGDSEGDLDHHHHQHNMMMMMGLGCHNDEDDAQSCSYDVWDSSRTNEAGNDVCRGIHKTTTILHHNDDQHHGHDNDDDDDGRFIKNTKEGIHSKISFSRDEDYNCTSEVMSTANSNYSSRRMLSCIDTSEGKKMSEKERNKLFWETCLAS